MLSTSFRVMQARYDEKPPSQYPICWQQHNKLGTKQDSENFFAGRAGNCRFSEQIVSVLSEDLLKWAEFSF